MAGFISSESRGDGEGYHIKGQTGERTKNGGDKVETILIVAREGQFVKCLKERLGSCYEIYVADNYDGGISLYCEKAPYAVIVEDIIKWESGIELSKRVRQDDMNTRII